MRHELKRIAPLRAANVAAVVYGLTMAAFMLLFSPFVLIAIFAAPENELGMAGPAFFLVMLLLYPIMGLVMGWISGILTAAIYNLVVKWTGGLQFELVADAPAGTATP